MRLVVTVTVAGLAALTLTGCEPPPDGEMPQLDLPEVDAPAPAPANGEEWGPVVPALPDTPGHAPEPTVPGEVTVLCDGATVLDYQPADADPQHAQGICADRDTDQHGFTESDPRSPDPFDNPERLQRDMQGWLDQQ